MVEDTVVNPLAGLLAVVEVVTGLMQVVPATVTVDEELLAVVVVGTTEVEEEEDGTVK